MRYGHDPTAIEAYPYRDVRAFLETLPELLRLDESRTGVR